MEIIKELRREKNITMKHLGEIIGVSESAVSQYENGKRQPDQTILIKIADYFNVSTDYLLGRSDTKQPTLPSNVVFLNEKNIFIFFTGSEFYWYQKNLTDIISLKRGCMKRTSESL